MRVMSLCRSLLLASALTFASMWPAAAQSRVPEQGMLAVGGWIGAAVPTGDGLDAGLHLAATLEGYLTPRVSVLGEVGGGWMEMAHGGISQDLPPPFVNVNLVYNWERGA